MTRDEQMWSLPCYNCQIGQVGLTFSGAEINDILKMFCTVLVGAVRVLTNRMTARNAINCKMQ